MHSSVIVLLIAGLFLHDWPVLGQHDDEHENSPKGAPSQHKSALLPTCSSTKNVLILGGGLAGLSTARHLLMESDVQVTLLEAKDRLGGRLYSLSLPHSDSRVDLGGMYWHGESNILQQLKQDLLFETLPTGGNSSLPGQLSAVWLQNDQSSWRPLTRDEIQASQNVFARWNATMNQNFEELLQQNTSTSQETWWKEAHQAFLANLSAKEQEWLRFYLHMNFDLDSGIPFHQHAIRGIRNSWDWIQLAGDDQIAPNGISSLIELLETDIVQQGGEIHLQQRVESIHHSLESGCHVQTSLGQDWHADVCVVTLPLGVLQQRSQNLFDPPLLYQKQSALSRAGLGTLNTVVVQWNQPICQDNSTAYYMLGHEDNHNNPLGHGFVCTGRLQRAQDSTIAQFHLAETNLPFDNETYWKEQAVSVVRRIVPTIEMSDILSVHTSRWHLDDDILGSFSAPTANTNGNTDRRILGQPESVLFFAGEHTHDTGRYQSMDGAYATGMRAAQQVEAFLECEDNI